MSDTDARSPSLRPTRQRRAITDALAAAADFQSAQEIHDSVRQGGDKVGLATVYRTLQAMADAGDVDVRHNPAGEATYRRCSSSHHHHLVCRSCGRTVEITGSAVERWAHAIADEHGFSEVSHTVELVGLCAECAARAARA
ncbi:Fur family transcriptional regulator [Pimelobacter simplex]|uniref:Zinc uptake regulation protein ZUR n=1 Tax=Nocardioides simplex TaxID=2045 RepID=A0A0A1DU64_NOCSI|nr:transcriptional repressor [Pimelobacter simplex]AIY18935.1 Zinc uptake regulation protein ZUR [Pimelobacter simplex]MCG8148870.1 transcriptional repressor [Pimelobacter simplex]GEB14689.1 transcriptional repressor [Pimelobacter simplex]SFM26763.1 zinc uptake regulator, Fur family [Pimelobacter simplex]